MRGYVARVGEVDAVAAHLRHDVLAEQNDLLERLIKNFSLPSGLLSVFGYRVFGSNRD